MHIDLTARPIDRALVVCSGPSAAGIDWQAIPEHVPIVAVNTTITSLPRAEYWLSCDPPTIEWIRPDMLPHGCQVVATKTAAEVPGAWCVPVAAVPDQCVFAFRGFDWDGALPGIDSGFAAINLAAVLGARRIAVVGLDGGGQGPADYWHPRPAIHAIRIPDDGRPSHLAAPLAAEQCRERGIEVRLGSPDSRVTAWPRCTPAEAIDWVAR